MTAGKLARLLQRTDRLIRTVLEVLSVYGKFGCADIATSPAPLEMFEATIQFKSRKWGRLHVAIPLTNGPVTEGPTQ